MAHEPLSDPTRRMRRALLGVSTVALMVGWLDLTITNIPVAGFEISAAQNALPLFLGLGIGWFALNYLSYLRDDLWSARDQRIVESLNDRLAIAKDDFERRVQSSLRLGSAWPTADINSLTENLRSQLSDMSLDDFPQSVRNMREVISNYASEQAGKSTADDYKELNNNIQEDFHIFESLLMDMSRTVTARNIWTWPGWRVRVVDSGLPFLIAALGLIALVYGDSLREIVAQWTSPPELSKIEAEQPSQVSSPPGAYTPEK